MTGIDTEAMMVTISDLVALSPRATGTEGGRAAADYVHRRFSEAGLDRVWFQETDSFRWHATESALTVGGESFRVAPILHSALHDHEQTGELGTGPEGVTARVVDIGSGKVKDHDVTGAIVLFDLKFTMSGWHLLPFSEYIHDPGRKMLRREVLGARNPYVTNLTGTMAEATEAGAVGLIGVLRDYPEDIGYHNEYFRTSLLELPGLWISAARGEQLRKALDAGGPATLTMSARREVVTSRTVIGVLEGQTRDTVMVQSHHDSVGPGAVEDASGTAEVIALAEHEAERAREQGRRAKTLMFVTFDTHFTGYQAHKEFVTRYALDPASEYPLVLNLTVEHIGLRARKATDGSLETLPETEPRAFFETLSPAMKFQLLRAIRRHELGSTTMLHASLFEFSSTGIPTDASFALVAGVPIASLISGPLYLYADADGLDQIDVDQLVPVANVFVDLIDAADHRASGLLGLVPRKVRSLLPRGKW